MKKINKIPSFSLFEVTLVLAILSILIGIITISLNRFNEQLKNNVIIYDEMNHFYAIRSTIWNDYYLADSVNFYQGNIILFKNKLETKYFVEDELLHRKNEQHIDNLNIKVNEIKELTENEKTFFLIEFDWKQEELLIKLPLKRQLKNQIDSYFNELL